MGARGITDRLGVEGRIQHRAAMTMTTLWRECGDGDYQLVAMFPTRTLARRFWGLLSDGKRYIYGTATVELETCPEHKTHACTPPITPGGPGEAVAKAITRRRVKRDET